MIYEYLCANGHSFEMVLPARDYKCKQICACGAVGERVISIPRLVSVQGEVNYDSPIDGRPITSRAQRREDLARNNCQEYDPEMRKDADRFRKRKTDELERSFDQTIEHEIEKMPVRKKERLANELQNGATAEIVRKT